MASSFRRRRTRSRSSPSRPGPALFTPWLNPLAPGGARPGLPGEAHFSAQGYALAYTRTADQRTLDYLRRTGASAGTAKEVKIFRAARLPDRPVSAAGGRLLPRHACARRPSAPGGDAAHHDPGRSATRAFAYLSWRTVAGDFSIGDLTFGAASFRRLRGLLEGLLAGFSQLAGQALYLDDLFSFFELTPAIRSPENPRPFPTPHPPGFVFEDVGFCYPGARRGRYVTWTSRCAPAEVLALVGRERGREETTLVKLLTRLYDPNEGASSSTGTTCASTTWTRCANLGVIFRDFVRCDLTAAE
ncbi:MAG: ABC transporter ATP-binding protein, partial [Gemmatimonadetes bacterium]|nr:ABC transporter ATP-binding protein [Gemmatimonadota bacterium]